jgi:uracil-DNA glycosylase
VATSSDALQVVAEESRSCTRCELYRRATQTVFGEGPVPAALMMVGERPNNTEVVACSHWLEREIELVAPQVLLVMGATAVGALFEGRPTIGALRGATHLSRFGVPAVVTVHPAAIVRLRDHDERTEQLAAFVRDLRQAVEVAASSNGGSSAEGDGATSAERDGAGARSTPRRRAQSSP